MCSFLEIEVNHKFCLKKSQKITYVKDFETSYVKDADEFSSFLAGLEGLVALLHNPLEDALKNSLGQSTHGIIHLFQVPALSDEFRSNLDLRLGKVFV